MEESVDRISDLPEELLLRILSFLPTKEAVATSLLSKTWRPLWRSLLTINLSSRDFKISSVFHRFGDNVLDLVDWKHVKKFVLKFDPDGRHANFRESKVNEWINVVTCSKLEHLELHTLLWGSYELPSRVFILENIKILKLSGVTMPNCSHVNFPLVDVLHLIHVGFSNSTSWEMLLNACPLLKDLAIKYPYGIDNALYITRLDHLVKAEVPPSLIPLAALSNATYLCLIDQKGGICPFTIGDDTPTFNNATHLECDANGWKRMVNCLQNFPKLQKLIIHKLGSSHPSESILEVPPCVSLHLKEFALYSFGGSKCEFEMVKFMMNNARVFRTIHCNPLSLPRCEYPSLES